MIILMMIAIGLPLVIVIGIVYALYLTWFDGRKVLFKPDLFFIKLTTVGVPGKRGRRFGGRK